MAFKDNVFINCPFDVEYYSLLRPLVFTVIYLGLRPRIALERTDSGETRIAKIIELIAQLIVIIMKKIIMISENH